MDEDAVKDETEIDVKANVHEPEEPQEVSKFIQMIFEDLIERVIPEPPRVLTFEQAGKCLSGLGKIWNLKEISPLMAHLGTVVCKESEDRLLDMEGYVEEYQYLHLEAVDMALSDVRIIPKHFVWVISVDVSGNRLTNQLACPLTKLPNLVSLKVNRNRFTDPFLPGVKHLQYLGMNRNSISSLHRIHHPNLETLDVNFNRIQQVDSCDCWKLPKLKQLELRGNELTTTAGVQYPSLVRLYLAGNRIVSLTGIENLVNLQLLHLRDNPLSDLSGLGPGNSKLSYLNIRDCRVQDLPDLKTLRVLPGLRVLVIKNNAFNAKPEPEEGEEPEEEEEDEETRVDILVFIPNLQRIDKKEVSFDERRNARERRQEEEEEE